MSQMRSRGVAGFQFGRRIEYPLPHDERARSSSELSRWYSRLSCWPRLRPGSWPIAGRRRASLGQLPDRRARRAADPGSEGRRKCSSASTAGRARSHLSIVSTRSPASLRRRREAVRPSPCRRRSAPTSAGRGGGGRTTFLVIDDSFRPGNERLMKQAIDQFLNTMSLRPIASRSSRRRCPSVRTDPTTAAEVRPGAGEGRRPRRSDPDR